MKLLIASIILFTNSLSFASDIYMRSGDTVTLGSYRVFCEAGGGSSQFTCECRLVEKPPTIGCAMKGYEGIKVRYVNGDRQEQALQNPSVYYDDCYTSSDPEGSRRRLEQNRISCRQRTEGHPECQF